MENIQTTETNQKENHSSQKLLYTVIALLALLVIIQSVGMFYFFRQQNASLKTQTAAQAPSTQADNIMNSYRTVPPFPRAGVPVKSFFAHDPFLEDAFFSFNRLQDQMNRMMSGFSSDPLLSGNRFGAIAIDLKDTGDAYVLTSDLPGLEKDQINVRVSGGLLTLQGVRRTESSSDNEREGFYAQERSYGSFSRTISLPGPVDEANVTAEYKEGVLTVTLPKAKEEKAGGKISVN